MDKIQVGTVIKPWYGEEYIAIGKVFSNCPQFAFFVIKREDFDNDKYTNVFQVHWSCLLDFDIVESLSETDRKRLTANLIKHSLMSTDLYAAYNLTYKDLSDFTIYCGKKKEIDLNLYKQDIVANIFIMQTIPYFSLTSFHRGNITDEAIERYSEINANSIVFVLE